MKLVKLSNGLRLALVPCEAQSVAFGLFIASGSRHEPDSCGGISHFIEHMLFKGTAKRSPIQISQAIEGRGGMFNAWTSEESTAFFAHMPFEYLNEAVDIISDMYLHAAIPADEFARERQVVLEEIKMYADEPDSVAAENFQRCVFPKSRLGAPVAGSAKSLLPLTPDDLRAYIRAHYRPDNTVAVLVGRFDPAAAEALVARTLGSLPKVRPPARRRENLLAPVVPEISATREVQQTQLVLGYRTFGREDERRFAASVFDAIMGRGMSSRLFQEVREKRGLSYDVSSRLQLFADAGYWAVSAGLDSANLSAALKTIDAQFKRITTTCVTRAELARTKEFLIGNFRLGYEKVQSKLFFWGGMLLTHDRLISPEEQIAAIERVTPEDIRAVARDILDPAQRVISLVTPKHA